jgi:hypothetical protein
LAGGGPAVQIMGEFDHKGGVKRCSLQYQDWGTPWTDFIVTGSDYQAMLTFCSMLLPQ